MGEWQNIETAPKDGTPLLLWCTWMDVGAWLREYDCWVAASAHEHCMRVWGAGELDPTHWMPLPPAPTEEG